MRSRLGNRKVAVKQLREDLRNGPLHCFGTHSNCNTDYCKVAQSDHGEHADTGLSLPIDTAKPSSIESVEITGIHKVAEQEQRLWEDALDEKILKTYAQFHLHHNQLTMKWCVIFNNWSVDLLPKQSS